MLFEQQIEGAAGIETNFEPLILQRPEQAVNRSRRRHVSQHSRQTAADDEIAAGIEQRVDEHPGDLQAHAGQRIARARHGFVPGQKIDRQRRQSPIFGAQFAFGSNDTRRVAGAKIGRAPQERIVAAGRRRPSLLERPPEDLPQRPGAPSQRTASERNAWRSPRPGMGQARRHGRRGSSRANAGIRRGAAQRGARRSPKCRLPARGSGRSVPGRARASG